jgi:hypothetical protein
MNSQLTRASFTVNAGSVVPRGDFKQTVGAVVRLVRIERARELPSGKMFVEAALYPADHPARKSHLTEASFL